MKTCKHCAIISTTEMFFSVTAAARVASMFETWQTWHELEVKLEVKVEPYDGMRHLLPYEHFVVYTTVPAT